jgi:hypothetical protein
MTRRVTLKALENEYDQNHVIRGRAQITAKVGNCVFADTKELAGTRRGWSGDWNVTNLKGETKHFTTEKGIREWLGQQEPASKGRELTPDEIKAELKRMKENSISIEIERAKGGATV